MVLVTGASGFVGSAIVRALLSAGHSVRAFVRPSTAPSNLAGLNVDIVEGDVCDSRSITRAMRGSRDIVHAAADYRLWARDPRSLVRTNVEGTRSVMEAALFTGAERVIYTSSVATLAPCTNGKLADETRPLEESDAIGTYKRSKVVAERLVEAMVATQGLPAIIVNPSAPIGPRDIRPTPTGRIIIEAASGRMPASVETGLNLVHVDDVADGHVAALSRGRIGERYILGGQNVMLAQILRDIARLVGRRPPWIRLPRGLLFPFAFANEAIALATGHEPFLTVDGLRMSKHRMFFTSAKAERELGFHARPYEMGLRDAIDWYRAAGRL